MPVDYDFTLYGNCIPKPKGFVYLGLPIGGIEFVEDFYLGKMRSCEKTLYSGKIKEKSCLYSCPLKG